MNKISFLLRKMKAIKNHSVLVAYSGGKDSLVCLDMACRIFDHVECYYLYLVRGISFIEKYMEWARQKYGVKIHYLPHPALSDAIIYGIYMPHYLTENIKPLSFGEIEAYIRITTGISWIMQGLKKTDTILRRAMLKNIDVLDLKRKKIFPVMEYTGQEIREYLKLRNIPLPEHFGRKCSGLDLQVKNLKFVYENYPEDFKLIKKKFPFCEVSLRREEYHAKENEISEV